MIITQQDCRELWGLLSAFGTMGPKEQAEAADPTLATAWKAVEALQAQMPVRAQLQRARNLDELALILNHGLGAESLKQLSGPNAIPLPHWGGGSPRTSTASMWRT